jgi:hypothetical protein
MKLIRFIIEKVLNIRNPKLTEKSNILTIRRSHKGSSFSIIKILKISDYRCPNFKI